MTQRETCMTKRYYVLGAIALYAGNSVSFAKDQSHSKSKVMYENTGTNTTNINVHNFVNNFWKPLMSPQHGQQEVRDLMRIWVFSNVLHYCQELWAPLPMPWILGVRGRGHVTNIHHLWLDRGIVLHGKGSWDLCPLPQTNPHKLSCITWPLPLYPHQCS